MTDHEFTLTFILADLSGSSEEFAEAFFAAGGSDGIVSGGGPHGPVEVGMIQQVATLETAIRNLAGWVRTADPRARIETIEVEPTPELLGVAEARAAAA